MQVVLTNIENNYCIRVSINFPDFLLHTFNSFKLFLIRSNAHGAHAKSSLLCHIQNIILFILFPYLIIKFDVKYLILLFLALIGFIIVIKNAPAATKKQPIPKRLLKRKKILSIVLYCFYSSSFIRYI